MSRTVRTLFGVSLILLLSSAPVWAQATGQITGTVTDATGALLPGVNVTATQTDTGIARSAVTNETGSVVMSNLPLGPYRFEAALPGFQTFVQTGITLQVNSSINVVATMEVGQVTQTIEVQADAAMVELRATGIGQIIDNIAILELPLVGREVQDLIVLTGATVQTGTESQRSRSYVGIARFSIAGGLERGTSYSLDGASHNDVRRNLGLPLPFPDALQEFKVETSAIPARNGFRSGAAVNAVTKSGTNQFHGNAFYFVRNEVFNARSFFENERDGLKRNQYGATIGGPIIQNKLFFFGGFQATLNRRAPAGSSSIVPTQAMIAGDFREFASAACQGRAVTLGAPFVDNMIDPALFSPAGVNLANRLPVPDDACGNTRWGDPVKTDEYQYLGRMDYQITQNHSLFARFMGYPYNAAVGTDFSDNALISGTPGKDDMFLAGTVGDTITIGDNKINSLRLGWNRQNTLRKNPTYFDVDDLGINAWHQIDGMIAVEVDDGFTVGSRTSAPNSYRETGYDVSNDLGWNVGNHQLNMGGTFRSFQTNNDSFSSTTGQWFFDDGGIVTNMADLLRGRLTRLQQGGPNSSYVRTKAIAGYIQDSWQVQSGLTLSMGIRWEPYLAQGFHQDINHFFDMDAFLANQRTTQFSNAPAGIFYPGDSGFPAGGTSNNPITNKWDKFAPRLGLSWDPMGEGRTVVRAAWGMFYETQTAELLLTLGQGAPWAGFTVLGDVSFDDPYADFPGGNPFPFTANLNSPYPRGGTYSFSSADTQPPYVQQWNVGVQHEIAPNWLVSATYLGNQVTHIYGSRELNPAVAIPGVGDANGDCFATVLGQSVSLNVGAGRACSRDAGSSRTARRILNLLDPTGALGGSLYGNVATWDDGGTRSYNGLILSMNKRMSGNFSATANYTWSHCIGNPVNNLLQGRPGTGNWNIPENRDYDRGNCITGGRDVRHIANATLVFNTPEFTQPWTQGLFGDWSISGILRSRSGEAFDADISGDSQRTGNNRRDQRPNQILDNPYGNKCFDDLRSRNPTCRWLSRDAFANPAAFEFGNHGLGSLFGPNSWQIDMGLSRTFQITEDQSVEFRAEADNVFNHANFARPNERVGSQLGRITRTSNNGRIIQLGLKYAF